MKMTIPELFAVLLPPGMEACVAGGYAAHPAMASDIDVWVMSPLDLNKVREDLLSHFYTSGMVFEEQQETRSHDITNALCGYEGLNIVVLKVAKVTLPDVEKPIHVMVTSAVSPVQVLCAFDISTHQIAIDQFGDEVMGPGWTPCYAAPEVLKNTPTTPARLEKITARYAHLRQEAHAR
jgi:hypothetical protein